MTKTTTIPESEWQVNNGPRLLKIVTPMAVTVTLFVGLRFGIRHHRRAGLGLDDWLILVSLVNIMTLSYSFLFLLRP